MIDSLTAGLPGPGWYGWDFWRVTTQGHHDPTVVLNEWTPVDVIMTSYNLQIANLLESLG